jgi:probable HAF family extracellular repeat protein
MQSGWHPSTFSLSVNLPRSGLRGVILAAWMVAFALPLSAQQRYTIPTVRVRRDVSRLRGLLNLSKDQQRLAARIYSNAAMANAAVRANLRAARASLATATKTNDTRVITQASNTIGKLRSQLATNNAQGQAAFVKILTPEQEIKYQQLASRTRDRSRGRPAGGHFATDSPGPSSSPAIPGLPTGSYTITDLGVLTSEGDTDSEALAVNNNGTVVGISGIYDGDFGWLNKDAFIWTPNPADPTTGAMTYLSGLMGNTCKPIPYTDKYTGGGVTGDPVTSDTTADDINNNGQVVGSSFTTRDGICNDGAVHGYLYSNGVYTDLGLPPGYSLIPPTDPEAVYPNVTSYASTINDAGQIAGYVTYFSGSTSPYPYNIWLYDGSYHLLGALAQGDLAIPLKINSKETIVGFSEFTGFAHTGTGPIQPSDAIGTLGGPESFAAGINNAGMIVGYADVASGYSHAFLRDQNGNMKDLGTLSDAFYDSEANSINNTAHDVVGDSDIDYVTAPSYFLELTHAVLWPSGGHGADLNLLLDRKLVVSDACSGCWELVSANAINDRGQIVGVGAYQGQRHAFLLTPKCINDGGDTDGDGLCDDWEKYGYTDPKTGAFVNLPRMGADPMHKDIFVQADYMVNSDVIICDKDYVCEFAHTHKPNPDAMNMVINAFANAPVENPDGLTGITIHIDCGSDCIMNPLTGETWGDLSAAQAIDPEVIPFGADVCDQNGNNCDYSWDALNAEMSLNFVPLGRLASFHYMIYVHEIGDSVGVQPGAHVTGIADTPGSNFLVGLGGQQAQIGSLSGPVGPAGTVLQQAGNFMHELGHNLGLMHGGQDDVNFKPNYLSIMNYNFTELGLFENGTGGYIDYSRFPAIPALNEYALLEPVGLNGGPAIAGYGTRYSCYDYLSTGSNTVSKYFQPYVLNANGPIDWNCNGMTDSAVLTGGFDIDNDQLITPTTITSGGVTIPGPDIVTTFIPHDLLASSEDWSHLIYAGGAIGSLLLAPNPPTSVPHSSEPPIPYFPSPYRVQVVSPGLAIVSPGISLNLTYTITNTGDQPDSYNLVPVSQSNWWNTSGVPASVSLASGASQQITIPLTVPLNLGCGNLSALHLTFLLRAVSQTYPNLMESDAAEIDVMSAPGTAAIPSVSGLPQSAAQAAIVAGGFALGTVTTSSSSSVPAGTVISQTPFGCGFAGPGAAISLVVSTGPAFVAMPNVVGDTQAAASTAITSAGLVLVSVSTAASLTVPAGMVISESPAAGTNVLVGSSAGILVSSGGSSSDIVPNVVGQAVGTADSVIIDAGLAVGTTTGLVSSTVTAGTVISETPTAGTSVTPGSSVNLTISVGPSSYTVVPNFTGDTLAQLESAIPAAGLVFGGVGYNSSLTVPAGQVISQNPLPGVFTSTGTPVYLAISAGLQPNTVPNLYGLSQSMASAALTAVGLKVGTVSPYLSGIYPPGYVLSQNPAPGNYATAGSTVSLTVAAGPTQFIVPDLSATNAALGVQALATAGLTMGSFTTAVSPTVSQGLFISQSPAAGTTVAAGSPVNAVYSAGSHLYPVPNVVGQGQDLATGNVLGAFFYVAITRQSSTTVPDGVVISQIPAGGSQALLGAIISLVVSSGGPVVGTVPNTLYDPNAIPYGTVGTLGQAVQAINAAGFAVGSVTTQLSPLLNPVPTGYVMSQSPAAGTQAPWGTSVSLVVSNALWYVATVPNLVGMTQQSAITTLQNAPLPLPLKGGLAQWTYALTTQSSATVPAGVVISQNPPPGPANLGLVFQNTSEFLDPVSFVVSAGPSPVPSYSYLSQFGSNGGSASQDGQLSGMYGLTIDPVSRNIIVGGEDGRIQIFDSNGNFKSYFGGHGLNLETYNNSLFGLQIVDLEGPVGNGLFFTSTQTALAVDPVNRNIIAVDVGGQRVMIFNSAGVFQSEFGTAGLGPGQFRFINYVNAGVAVDPVTENILVTDAANSRVQVFNSAGVYLSQFGTAGGGYGQFGNPSGIAIDPTTRNIVVADWGANRVDIFNSSGGYLSQFGGPGASNGTFYEPTAIAIDPATHNILLASAGTGNTSNPYLQIFSSAGVYLSQFGGFGLGNGNICGGSTGLAFDPVSHNIVVTGCLSVEVFGLAASSSGSTTTALVTSSNPASFGQLVTFTATVTGNSPTGTVQFLDGATSLGTPVVLTAGVTALSTSSLAVGPHSITAVYSGDASNPGSTSAGLSETISPNPSKTTAVSSLNPSIAGQAVTFTATVTGSSPTGTVEFLSGATSLAAPVALASGVAAFTTSILPVGTDSITAVYSGDSSNATSTSSALNETVSLAPTITAVVSSAGHASFGQPVTFTAVVSGDSPTGNVQFFDGATSLATPVALIGNVATFTTSTLVVGTHSITAAYKGDALNSPSTSPALSEFISTNAPTATTLVASVDPIIVGQSVTFTATVTGTSPTGAIQFMDGIASLGSPVALTSGTTSLTTSALTIGTHSITAVYPGDAANAASTSAVVNEVVSRNATATTVTSTANPANVGQFLTLSAAVTGGNPTGPVQFMDGTTTLRKPVALAGGQASITLAFITAGMHSITVVYNGDGNNTASTSAALNQKVLATTTTAVTSSLDPSVFGQSVTFTATVTGSSPTGTIQFLDGATSLGGPLALTSGAATLATSALTVGTHSITAVYSGDASNTTSTSAILSEVISAAAAPPVVTPPAAISVPATQAGGATSGAWPALAAFLAGATATSTVSPAPTQLAPQVGSLAVTGATLFPIGTTTVTFQFKDANGNIGSATSNVTVAVGTPRITGSSAGVGVDPSGAIFVKVVLTNTGTGNARNLKINTLVFRALSGTGTITYNTALSPSLPLAIGNLDVGASVTSVVYLNVPSTVTRMSITESGPVQDVSGTNYNYSTAEAVIP